MAWNQSTDKLDAQTEAKKPFFRNLILWGIVIAVIGFCGICYLLTGKDAPKHPKPDKSKMIRDVAPSVPVVTNTPPDISKKKWPDKPPHKDGIWRHGEGPRSIAVTNGCVVSYPNDPTVEMIIPRPQDLPPFKNICDNEIASILSIKPGQAVIELPLPRDFDKRFRKVVDEPIEITEDDPPEKAELKRQVIEARAVLKEAMDRGESPRQILIDERKNLRKLMGIRDNYQAMVNEQIKKNASDQEIADTVAAANMLLEKKGINTKVRLPYKEKLRIDKAKKDGAVKDIQEL